MNYLSFRDAVFVSTADTMEYVIKCGTEYIFRGIAVKAPGEDTAIVNVGEICSQYLDNQMPDFRDFHDVVTKQPQAYKKFVLFSVHRTVIWTGPETFIDDVTEHAEAVYNFLNCWDYDNFAWDNEDMALSDPVNGHLDCRMKLMYTQYGETTGASFYATPILSAKPEGSTVTADILTEYTDPSLLNVVVGNSSVTIVSVSLTGVTYTTSANSGYTYSTTAEYYYNGEKVGETQIVVAGDLGEGEDTGGGPGPGPSPEPVQISGGTICIPGTANWPSTPPCVALYGEGLGNGNTGWTVYGSDYITARTDSNFLDFTLINQNSPAPIGDRVYFELMSGDTTVTCEAVVTSQWSGVGFGDEVQLLDSVFVDSYTIHRIREDDDISKCRISAWQNFSNGTRSHKETEGDTVKSSEYFKGIRYEDNNNSPGTALTISNNVLTLSVSRVNYQAASGYTGGLQVINYGGTLSDWNSLIEIDGNTEYNAECDVSWLGYTNGNVRYKTLDYYGVDTSSTITVHCTDGDTTWGLMECISATTLPHEGTVCFTEGASGFTVGEVKIYTGVTGTELLYKPIAGNASAIDLGDAHYYFSGASFPSATVYKAASGFSLTYSSQAVVGETGKIGIVNGQNQYFCDMNYEIVSSAVTSQNAKSTFIVNGAFDVISAETEGYGFEVVGRDRKNQYLYFTFCAKTNFLAADGILYREIAYRESVQPATVVRNSASQSTIYCGYSNNVISINVGTIGGYPLKGNMTFSAKGSKYVGILIRDYSPSDSPYSLTDLYLDCTVQWFNSLPMLTDATSDVKYKVPLKRGKIYIGKADKPITVHCTDGDVVWVADTQDPSVVRYNSTSF